jgi:hypothetical protein
VVHRRRATDDIRILDIDGARHYFYTTYLPGTPAGSRAELEQMVESLVIEPVVYAGALQTVSGVIP